MDMQLLLQPQVLPQNEKLDFWGVVDVVATDPAMMEKVHDYLDKYFKKDTYLLPEIAKYYDTYWMAYVRYTWKLADKISTEDFVEIFSVQLQTALQLDIDITAALLKHVYFNIPIEKQANIVEELYTSLSSVIFPLHQSSDTTLREIHDEYAKIMKGDTLQSADFFAKIEQGLLPDNLDYMRVSREQKAQKVSEFLNLLLFIFEKQDLGKAASIYINELVEPVEALAVNDDLILDELVENALKEIDQEEARPSIATQIAEVFIDDNGNERSSEDIQKRLQAWQKGESPSLIKTQGSTNPYTTIKQQLISQFADESGNITNIEGLFDALDTMANEQGDEHIRELYMFDEAKGSFVWNESLLST